MKYKNEPSADPILTAYVGSPKKHTLSRVYGPWYLSDIRPKLNLHRRLLVGRSEILNDVCKPHVCDQDKEWSVVVPPRVSSGMQVLLCQRTRRNEVMNVNTVKCSYWDLLYFACCMTDGHLFVQYWIKIW